MTTDNKAVITAALDTLTLFSMLADDFQPRTLKQVCEFAAHHNFPWSQTKIFNMLETLAAGNFLRQSQAGEWSVSPHITAIAVAYQESIIRRCQTIQADIAEINKSTQERMQ